MPRRNNKTRNRNQGNLGELLLFVLIIFCFYCILALFDSSFTGEGGREWGKYLRDSWGGALIVPLLFIFYLCIAKLLKFRVPRVRRQILGTLQLYISFSFMLGLLRETGWRSDWTLFQPGGFGHGLARFFTVNFGPFITLLLVIASFVLTAFLFGSRILKISMPALNSINLPRRNKSRRRPSNDDEATYLEDRPENVLFPTKIPSPKFKKNDSFDETMQFSDPSPLITALNAHAEIESMNIPAPVLKNSGKTEPAQESKPDDNPFKRSINIFDNLITSIKSGEMSAPEKKQPITRQKRFRRPLPNILQDESPLTPEPVKDSSTESEGVQIFPPPYEIYGPRIVNASDKNLLKSLEKQGKQIISALKNFGVNASVAHIINGAAVTQYQLELAPGTKVNRILELTNDLAMSLAVMPVRIEAPIWGTHYAGVEVPAQERKIIPLRNIIDSDEFRSSPSKLTLPLGCKINGEIFVQGLEVMPNILIAGNSGAGKSVFINSCVLGICSKRKPDEVKFLMIDTRQTDFAAYENLSHMMSAPVYDVQTALKALNFALHEMESRIEKFSQAKVRNITAYNRIDTNEKLPLIVIIINEIADLIYSAGSETENLITRLSQRAGASGIHMIIATQTPDSITNLIKSNIPARAAFTLQSLDDSKNIIDSSGAEKLTGKGDLLFKSAGYPLPIRLQAPFISDEKISEFVEYMSGNLGMPDLINF